MYCAYICGNGTIVSYFVEFAVKSMDRLCLVMLALTSVPVQGEIYTALVDMKELLESEAALLRTLDDYITAQDRRLQQIKKLVNYYINKQC